MAGLSRMDLQGTGGAWEPAALVAVLWRYERQTRMRRMGQYAALSLTWDNWQHYQHAETPYLIHTGLNRGSHDR